MDSILNGVLDEGRIVDSPNITNFRDLGGCPCKNGRVLKPMHFYRSGALSNLDQGDLDVLKAQNIRMILDLRSHKEVERDPDKVPEGCDYYHFPGMVTLDNEGDSLAQYAGGADMKSVFSEMLRSPEERLNPVKLMNDGYKTMARSSGAFKSMFSLIKEHPAKPLLVHCSAGKDRTGVAAALILLCLGASEETVMEDYLLSNKNRIEENRMIMDKMKAEANHEGLLDTFRILLEVDESLLSSFIKEVYKLYGSWDSYFEKALTLSEEDRHMMQERYLV